MTTATVRTPAERPDHSRRSACTSSSRQRTWPRWSPQLPALIAHGHLCVGLAERVGAPPFGEFPAFLGPALSGWTVEVAILLQFATGRAPPGLEASRGQGRDLEAGRPGSRLSASCEVPRGWRSAARRCGKWLARAAAGAGLAVVDGSVTTPTVLVALQRSAAVAKQARSRRTAGTCPRLEPAAGER